jgi:hypothetical protein
LAGAGREIAVAAYRLATEIVARGGKDGGIALRHHFEIGR